MEHESSSPAAPGRPPASRRRYLMILGVGTLVVLMGALVAGRALQPSSPLELSKAGPSETANFVALWKSGNLVVLLRHAERCDRSSHACLGPADGITQVGQDEALRTGRAFANLGMSQSDVYNSPLTRTTQTAQAMFNGASTAQGWLLDCEKDMTSDINAHKRAGRNLVLVTHSGCISQVEARLDFPHARPAEYTSALITLLGPDGKLQMLGVIDAEDWPTVLARSLSK